MTKLNIVLWNANGLRHKMSELIHFLSIYKVDIMCISETKLTDIDRIKIRHFSVHRQDRTQRRGGGVAILVRARIPHKLLNINLQSSVEHIIIKLSDDTHIVACYNPPSNTLTHNDLDNLISPFPRVLLMGDLNARHIAWKNHVNNTSGLNLYTYTLNNNVALLHTSTPTHIPLNGMTPTYIDIVLNKNITQYIQLSTKNELNSDHLPVFFSISSNINTQNYTNLAWTYNNANWDQYKNLINQNLQINNNISTAQDINREVERFTDLIQNARAVIGKKVRIRPREDVLPEEITDLIKARNNLRKIWQRHRRPQDREQFNLLSGQITLKIAQHKNNIWQTKLQGLNIRDNSLWKMTKILTKTFRTIPTLEDNNIEAFDDKQKSEMFAKQFATVHTPRPSTTNEQRDIDECITNLPRSEMDEQAKRDTYISHKNLKMAIRSFSNNKAPGPDGISYLLLKKLPRKAQVQLLYLINAIVRIQYFPIAWKEAIVIPIYKVGKDATKPGSYRPIALLNTMAKVSEKLILHELTKHAENNKTLPSEQFGFRRGHNTTLLAARMIHDAQTGFQRQQSTLALFLDVEKAFDAVWHEGLLYKLLFIHNYPLHIVNLIKSYLQGRYFRVRVGNSLSSQKLIRAGVPQGTVIAPLLYSLYTADIPRYPNTNFGQYADDTVLYASSYYVNIANKQLKYHLLRLLPYFEKWKIKINSTKTEQLLLTQKISNVTVHEPLKIDGTAIQPKSCVKYLGIKIDKRLSFVSNTTYRIQQTYAALQKLYSLLSPRSHMTVDNKILLYKTILRPTLTYACPVWIKISNKQRLRLQRLQNKTLRKITGYDRYTRIAHLHENTGLETINEFIDTIGQKFYKTQIYNSPLTSNITQQRQHNVINMKHLPIYSRLPIYSE